MVKNGDQRPIAITGLGVLTSLGRGVEENWRALLAGTSGIRSIERFNTEGLRTTIAGCVDFIDLDTLTAPALSHAMADAALAEALDTSGICADGPFPGELFLAAPPIEFDWATRERLSNAFSLGKDSA